MNRSILTIMIALISILGLCGCSCAKEGDISQSQVDPPLQTVEVNATVGEASVAYSDGWIYYTVPLMCNMDYRGAFDTSIEYMAAAGLFKVRPNGSERQQLVNGAICFVLVSERYVYYATPSIIDDDLYSSSDYDFYRICVDGTEKQYLFKSINDIGYEPFIALADDKLYLDKVDGLYVIDTDDGTTQLIANAGYQTLLYEDGKVYYNKTIEAQTIFGDIYDSIGYIFVRSIEGGEEICLSELLGTDKIYLKNDWLYFTGYTADDDYLICRMKKDGSEYTQVANITNDGYIFTDIAITNDYLYYYTFEGQESEKFSLYRIEPDGSNKKLLLTNGWNKDYEPNELPSSYFASNFTFYDGNLYTILHERPFENKIEDERYSLVKINAESGEVEIIE